MVVKYVKNQSGYCYKVYGDNKTRISKEEYKKKTKKTRGGNYVGIHPTNLPTFSRKTIKQCSSKCNTLDKNSQIKCISECKEKEFKLK
jgi:hypothetical protein